MRADVNGTQIELAPNSKPYLLKRMLADGFDIALIFGLFMLFTMLLLKTPLADAYQSHFARSQAIEQEIAAEAANDPDAAAQALRENREYLDEVFTANLHSYLLKAAACFPAELLILLLVPLFTGDRVTPGKLLTGIMPFNEKRQSRITKAQVLYRFLFVFLIDSLALYLYTGILTFLLVPVLRLSEMLLNSRKNKTLCDLITGVTMIEKLSYDGIQSSPGG